MEKKGIALFIGRFQPFHKGHLLALRWIAKRSAKVIVMIGSAQKQGERENPFSARERMRMMRAELAADGLLKKCRLVAVKDVNSDERWVGHVDAHLPRYDVCYSNNALVLKLMKRAGKKAMRVPFFSKEKYNATKIRERIREEKEWKARVPRKVAAVMGKINGEERIRES